ncbi:MAG: type IVB secretion system protein DotA [Legionellales bacterium]
MIKLAITILVFLFPALVVADSGSLSFAPPAGDFSVIFLGNLFGVVDGVLHGTGSQIMGAMFAVFNAAVLALGGIIIMYTLMVSTMNTAHEGQMLGQKWSSIWIPVRSTLGLALLIPKASGYCLMQVFVMWLVVQGVGAADKVWDAALSYLSRGGVIIQAQATNPTQALTSSSTQGVVTGAAAMLSGQVCMLGLQKQLEKAKAAYLLQGTGGPCGSQSSLATAQPGSITTLCYNDIPDFLGSVNAVVLQSQNPVSQQPFSLPMPNFTASTYPAFAYLNGICGTIAWNPIAQLNTQAAPTGQTNSVGGINIPVGATGKTFSIGGINNISSTEYQTAQMSRAIAVQQMYLDLSTVTQIMINNDPQIVPPMGAGTTTGSVAYNPLSTTNATQASSTTAPFNPMATQQFGVPYTANGTICQKQNTQNNCTSWGMSASSNQSGILFNGTEFQGAISDYNGIMMSTVNLIASGNDASAANASRMFISDASSKGWLMAGTYFFNLVQLNGNAAGNSNATDSNTGLENSKSTTSGLADACNTSGGNANPTLCGWFNKDPTSLLQVESLINGQRIVDGTEIPASTLPNFQLAQFQNTSLEDANQASSTVYGFINNSLMVVTPNQPGLAPLNFDKNLVITVDTTPMRLKKMNFSCGKVTIVAFHFCLGGMFGDLIYNDIFLNVYNAFMVVFQQALEQFAMNFLQIPLQGISSTFQQGISTLSQPGVNPIIALANMGVQYINFSGSLWMMLMGMSVTAVLTPFGLAIFMMFIMAMPLILGWLGIMTTIGFTTAYYIPLLPYMIFLFGTIAWLMCVIEAMVAAPIVALGVTHPEGHEAFGKGEQAIMILLNVFLRPAMMIIGYIAAIALSYVGVWVLTAGFDQAVSYMQGGALQTTPGNVFSSSQNGAAGGYSGLGANHNKVSSTGTNFNTNPGVSGFPGAGAVNKVGVAAGEGANGFMGLGSTIANSSLGNSFTTLGKNISGEYNAPQEQGSGSGATIYSSWAGIYAFFFSILSYTTLYLILIQNCFSLITTLPDKILRWIGGTPEQLGQESSRWGEELKQSGKEAGKTSQDTQSQIAKQLKGKGDEAVEAGKNAMSKSQGGGGDIKGT